MSLWTLRLVLADEVRLALERLRSSGIPGRWSELTTRLHVKGFFDRRIKIENATRTKFLGSVNLPPMPLKLDSTPTIVFLVYAYAILVAVGVMILEVVFLCVIWVKS